MSKTFWGNPRMAQKPEVHKPFPIQYIIDWWADGLKILGAGNGTGLLASIAALQYFSDKPAVLPSVKLGATLFLLGVVFFALAFFILIGMIAAFDAFLASKPPKPQRGFKDMIRRFYEANKVDGKMYILLVICSLISVGCFFAGCLSAHQLIRDFNPRPSIEIDF